MDIFERLEWIPPSSREAAAEGKAVPKVYYRRASAKELAQYRRAQAMRDINVRSMLEREFGVDGATLDQLVADSEMHGDEHKERREAAERRLARLHFDLGEEELRPYLDVALKCVLDVEGIKAGGRPIIWDDDKLAEMGIDKERVLSSLGRDSIEATASLQDLAAHMLTGLGQSLGKSENTST